MYPQRRVGGVTESAASAVGHLSRLGGRCHHGSSRNGALDRSPPPTPIPGTPVGSPDSRVAEARPNLWRCRSFLGCEADEGALVTPRNLSLITMLAILVTGSMVPIAEAGPPVCSNEPATIVGT